MSHVVNTYGTRKKKRVGILKSILKANDDPFEGLTINSLKETKAHNDVKRRRKPKKKQSPPKILAARNVSFGSGDTTFDRLLNEGPVNDNFNVPTDGSVISTTSTDLERSCINKNKSFRICKHVSMKRGKGNRLKWKSILNNFERQDHSSDFEETSASKISNFHVSNLCHMNSSDIKENCVCNGNTCKAEDVCKSTVLQEERGILGVSPISPILQPQYGSTSTPCSLSNNQVTGNLNLSLFEGDSSCNSIIDLCSPFESKYSNVNCQLPSPTVSQSNYNCNVYGINKSKGLFDSKILNSSECFDELSVITSSFKDVNLDVDKNINESIDLFESEINPSENFDELINVTSSINAVGDIKQSCDSGDEHSASVHDGAKTLRDCRIVLHRCDSQSALHSENPGRLGEISQNCVDSGGAAKNCDMSNSISLRSNVVVACQKEAVEVLECKVVVTRCDELVAGDSEDCQDSVCSEVFYKQQSINVDAGLADNNMTDNEIVPSDSFKLRSNGVLIQDVDACNTLPDSALEPDNSSAHFVCQESPNHVTTLTHPMIGCESRGIVEENFSEMETLDLSSCRKSVASSRESTGSVVLKPGKQWRRSLSMWSKVVTGTDESSTNKRMSLAVPKKPKGKLWESSVNSLIQLQPASAETILEVSEVDCSLLCVEKSISLEASTVACDMQENSRIESNASQIYKLCGQDKPIPFSDVFPPRMKRSTKKIGEGVYGEVFFFSGSPASPPSVIKIIPIEGDMEVNGEQQKTFGEILSELKVAQELSKLRNGVINASKSFNEVQAIQCVQGRYPHWLQELWHVFDASKGSENDSPEIFGPKQLYIVLKIQHGGQDLESFVFSSANQGLAAFRQVALALAVAETALEFEHRDLHWGNVLISNTKNKEVTFILNGKACATATHGIEVSIIDFTLSRISDPISGQPIFYDLVKDETLFTAQGDYQFDIYRMMKNFNGNRWDTFTPKTNVAWLHYLLDKLSTPSAARYKNKISRVHKQAIETLSQMREALLIFDDVSSFVKSNHFECNIKP